MSRNGTLPLRRTYEVFVTPDMAAKWLEGNVINRDLRQSNINYFIRLLQRGEFLLTHQGIAFTPDGKMIDGQHRLWAIVQSGIGAMMQVTENADPATFNATDGGRPRSIADYSHVKQKVVAVAGAITRIAHRSFASLTTEQSLAVVHALHDDIDALWRVTGTEKRGLTTGPIRAGFVAFAILHPNKQEWTYRQYELYVHGKVRECSESIASIYARFVGAGRGRGGDDEVEQFLRTYQALRSPNVSKTLVRDRDSAYLIARDVLMERGIEPFWSDTGVSQKQRARRDKKAEHRDRRAGARA